MSLPQTMRAARLHRAGEPMVIDNVPVPEAGGSDVVVRVKACNIVPNLANVLSLSWFDSIPRPAFPAIFGLDPAGVVEQVGPDVHNFTVGDRVYVNPGRHCGGCRACGEGDHVNCESYAFSGYFGFTQSAARLLDRYPHGGLCEYMLAPEYSLVRLPETISFEHGARFGYLGTAYSALRKAGVGPAQTVLVNGISGTLGIGVALFALAMGATHILGTGRNRGLLNRVEGLAPHRIETFSMLDGPVDEWVRRVTGNDGADVYIDALGPGAPYEGMQQGMMSLRRGGRAVNIGAVNGVVPFDVLHMMIQQLSFISSTWFTTAEGQQMAQLVNRGLVDLNVFENVISPLDKVNGAISETTANRNGGFSNFIIIP